MKFGIRLSHVTSISFILLISSLVFAKESGVVADELIVKLKGNPQASKSNLFIGNISNKMKLKATYGRLGLHHLKAKPGQKIEDLVKELQSNPEVEYVEPNYILNKIQSELDEYRTLSLEEGEEFFAQSGITPTYIQSDNPSVKVVEAWENLSQGYSQRPIIAVIDTGIDYNHPVFTSKNALWKNLAELNGTPGVDDDGNGYIDDIWGWNFVENNSNPMDSSASDVRSHGTHVSGIILGVTQPLTSSDESRIQIMGLKFLGSGGSGSTSAAIQAIYYAVNNGAKVINMSWGGGAYSQALHDALAYAYNQGVILIAAAGNSAKDNDNYSIYPANFPIPSQLTVAAINDFDYLANFSNYGLSRVHISAPGVSIYSTSVGSYSIMSGTSMAAPFVAGLASLILAERPSLTGYQVKNLIVNSSDSVSTLVDKVYQGHRAQVLNSVLNAKNLVSINSTQPVYSAIKPNDGRSPASELEATSSGGCGVVSTSVMSRWIHQRGTPFNINSTPWGLLLGLSLLPLILWNFLRLRAQSSDFISRRRYERFAMNSQIKVKVGDRELVGQMNTISAGGLSFKADTLLEKGGLVTLQIASPDGGQQLEVQGRIVWSEENQAYGVQFNEEKSEIGDWSKQLSKAS